MGRGEEMDWVVAGCLQAAQSQRAQHAVPVGSCAVAFSNHGLCVAKCKLINEDSSGREENAKSPKEDQYQTD